MFEGTNTDLEPLVESAKPLTRRQLLRVAAMGSVALAGGAALAACGGGAATPSTVKVTFLTNGWPGDSMPTADQQKASVNTKAYADSLAKWLKQNPGVTIQHTDTTIWDQQKVIQAISAGVAPTWYEGNILGSFQNGPVRSAFARGLASDLSGLVASTRLESQLTDFYLPVFQSWKVNGKFYGTPGGYGVGDGMFYRRDLIKELGLQEPTVEWTWTDFRNLAKALTTPKRKGAALQGYVFDQSLFANQIASSNSAYGTQGMLVDPNLSWPWRFDLQAWESVYDQVVSNWRGMYFIDKSITSQPSTGDSDVAQAFARGDVAMMANNTGYFTRPVSDPTSAINISKKLNKPFEEIVGWIAHPKGYLGSFGATQAGSAIASIDPHFQRNQAGLAKAFDFAVQMLVGQSLVEQRQAVYKSTNDLKEVFQEVPPMSKLQVTYGLKGTAEDAWGALTMKALADAASIPALPDPGFYFPAETNASPTGDAFNDANSGLGYTNDPIAALIAKLEKTQNTQFGSLASSTSKADFISSANKFFADLDTLWAQHAPTFSASSFRPWYQQKILPALGS